MQKNLLLYFLVFILFYHILHTFVVYGQGWLSVGVFSSIKEVWFLAIILYALRLQRDSLQTLVVSYKNLWIVITMIFVVFLWVSCYHHIPLDSIMVGIKYDLWWMVILMWGIILGMNNKKWIINNVAIERYIFMMLWIVILWWIVWQTGKVLFPDFFSRRGYGPIGDYVLWSDPPLWYRTGPGGWMRFSGIFSGPNNLWYFMVAFFPLVASCYLSPPPQAVPLPSQGGLARKLMRSLAIAMILITIATLSRAAIWSLFFEIICLLYFYKKEWRSYLSVLLLWGIAAGIGLLLFKRWSTLEHLSRLLDWLQVAIAHPWWLWLGIAGPSIHYKGVYLPENQFLQRAIDGWFLGLCLILIAIFVLWKYVYSSKNQYSQAFFLGFLGLLLVWCVLHSFEDSMVNYSFFLLFGCVLGNDRDVHEKYA